MRRLSILIPLALISFCVLCVRGPGPAHALSGPLEPTMVGTNSSNQGRVIATTDAGSMKVAPAPMAPDLNTLRPDGGPISVATAQSDCAFIGAGRSFELTCETGKCHYRFVSQLPDAGWPQVFPDAGVASPFDTPLPAEMPHIEHLPTYRDSVCAYFEAAGSLSPSPLFQ